MNIEIYEAGSDVAIRRSGIVGVVEKAIIGQNGSVSYQVICYTPERHQVVCSDFELTTVDQNKQTTQVGFYTGNELDKKYVEILVDGANSILDIDTPDEVSVVVTQLSDDDVKVWMEKNYEKEEEQEEEKNQ